MARDLSGQNPNEMRGQWGMCLLAGASVVCVLLTCSGCFSDSGGSGDETGRVEMAMRRHVSTLSPAESETDLAGPVRRVDCERSAMQFRGEDVWVCGITHQTGTVAEWCGVLSGDELLTSHSHRKMPCAGRR
jgi:hypothetical protein